MTNPRDGVPLHGLERLLFGYLAKAAERLNIKLRTDVRDNMLAWLCRLVRRANGQTVKLMPSVDSRKWRQDAAQGRSIRPVTNKSIRSYRTRLTELGLIDAHDHGQFWVIRFRFSLATVQSLLALRAGGKVSPHTYPAEGDSPTGNPPEALKEPAVEPSAASADAEQREEIDQEQAKAACLVNADLIAAVKEQLRSKTPAKRVTRMREASQRKQREWELEQQAKRKQRTALTGKNSQRPLQAPVRALNSLPGALTSSCPSSASYRPSDPVSVAQLSPSLQHDQDCPQHQPCSTAPSSPLVT